MLMKVCAAAAIALRCLLTVPSASFAQDKDKAATTHHTKAKKGHSDAVHENAGYRRKKGHADTVHENPR